jgi:uncharacterized protein YdhG (YjbR/CyaY superfamily)
MSTTLKRKAPSSVDEYLLGFPPAVRTKLEQLRKLIRKNAPGAEECISYGIAGYKYKGMLIYFAGFKNHVSLYPAPREHKDFKKELEKYAGGKGTVQFPLDKPIPAELVKRIVQFRVRSNEEQTGQKQAGKKKVSSASKIKPSDEDQVKAWLDKLETSIRQEIEAVRKIIRTGSPKLNERIKWNAPSYYYKDDILTFGPYKKDNILLVVHHPAVVKVKSALLEGDYQHRRLIRFKNSAEAHKNKKELARIINTIIRSIDH